MKARILLVEDDQAIGMLLREALQIADFSVDWLDDGEKAIKRLEEIRKKEKEMPDLVLLDLILPDMNGIEILKEARKYNETKNLKIFALTNYSNPEFNQELMKEGINKILIKVQYTLDDLVKIVEEATTQN